MIVFDLVIVGAGPSGSWLGKLAAARGLRVAIMAPEVQRDFYVGESLPSSAGRILQSEGLGDLLQAHLPSTGLVSRWGENQAYSNDAIRHPGGGGWHLDRARFDRDLLSAARAAGTKLIAESLMHIAWREGVWHLAGKTCRLQAKWVVDATGRSSRVASLLGFKRLEHEDLASLHFSVATDDGDRDARGLLEATPAGWWYSARVPNGRRVFSFQTSSAIATQIFAEGRDLGLNRALAVQVNHFSLYETFLDRTSAAIMACRSGGSRLEQSVGAGWLAVGDAALAFDPLSSQGLFHALATAHEACGAVVAALNGQTETLKAYADRLEEVWNIYQNRRAGYYALEGRWRNSEFWRGQVA